MNLNKDVISEIVINLELKDKYRFKSTNHYFYNHIQIKNINMENIRIDHQGLTSLDISKSVAYNHEILSYVHYTKLKHLKLSYHSIFANQLVKLPYLTSLHITPWLGTNFEDLDNRGIASLTILTNLGILKLDFCIDIPNINQFTNLKTLSVYKLSPWMKQNLPNNITTDYINTGINNYIPPTFTTELKPL